MKKILFVASEAHPFASSGGLADVIGSLPKALVASGEADCRVIMPLYSSISAAHREKMSKVCEFWFQYAWRNAYCGVWSTVRDGVTFYFIDNEYYFKRATLYGQYDDGERYAYFCRAVMEALWRIDFIPDVLHAHDWQAALSVVYLRRAYSYPNTRAVYTIHNIEYQGVYGMSILGDVFSLSDADRQIVEYKGDINLTKGAIVCADRVTTVSPRYAGEIHNEYFASGLQHAIRNFSFKVSGIINGIDVDYYNPKTDAEIIKNFSANKNGSYPAGKRECKAHLQRLFGLPESPETPLVVMISRLVAHKGFDLVRFALEGLLQSDVQFILLGTGEREFEEYFKNIRGRYPNKFALMLGYNKDMAKQIYAGGDIFLMPSKSEPCGLAQMIASRYGTVALVRETGGLYDSIKPFNPETGEGNGMTFVTYNASDMADGVYRAIGLYGDKARWKRLVSNAMNSDFSWDASAKRYTEMYGAM